MHCTNCGAVVPDAAKFCPSCGHTTAASSAPTTPPATKEQGKPSDAAKGCGCLIGIVIAIALLPSMCGKTEEQKSTDAAASAEDKRKGFHCLSSWDGSSREFVKLVKENLRDPESFEHDETKITPVESGSHKIFMKYRARNGFGGMNAETAVGTIDNATCAATLTGSF